MPAVEKFLEGKGKLLAEDIARDSHKNIKSSNKVTGGTWRQILDYGRMRLLKTKHPNVQDSNDVSTSFPGFSPTHPTSRFLLSPQLTIIPWLLRWLNTVWRAVSGNTRDGACFKLDKQTWRRKSNGTQNWFIKHFAIFGRIFTFIVWEL